MVQVKISEKLFHHFDGNFILYKVNEVSQNVKNLLKTGFVFLHFCIRFNVLFLGQIFVAVGTRHLYQVHG